MRKHDRAEALSNVASSHLQHYFFHCIRSKECFIVRHLLAYGVGANTIHCGYHALAVCRDKDTVDILLSSGADLEARNHNGDTPLALCRNVEIAKLLLAKGADIYTINEFGKSLLNQAAIKGNREFLILLLEKGLVKWGKCLQGSKYFIELFENYHRYLDYTNAYKVNYPAQILFADTLKEKTKIIRNLFRHNR
ncbi:hypothetical protein BS50DRAFT_627078, partial [Corynespora cassiicola Philippines]